MKKIFFILGSFLMFAAASAQTDTATVPTKKPVKTERTIPQVKKDNTLPDSTDYNKNRGRTKAAPKDITDPKRKPVTKPPKTTKNPSGSPDTPPKTPMN